MLAALNLVDCGNVNLTPSRIEDAFARTEQAVDRIVQAGAGTEAAVNQTRVRREWTEIVLLILLIALVVESTFAWFCGRAW